MRDGCTNAISRPAKKNQGLHVVEMGSGAESELDGGGGPVEAGSEGGEDDEVAFVDVAGLFGLP